MTAARQDDATRAASPAANPLHEPPAGQPSSGSPAASGRLGPRLWRALAMLWHALRVWSGDAAYDVYAARGGGAPLGRREFYLESVRRRYQRPTRCC